jgi:hypothetical protein
MRRGNPSLLRGLTTTLMELNKVHFVTQFPEQTPSLTRNASALGYHGEQQT